MSSAAFGLALACFFGFTALGSSLSAWLVERLGAAPQLAIAAVAAGMSMVALGSVSSAVGLVALLAAGGLANSLVGPATGRILGSMVRANRLFVASGMVQAALASPPLTAGLLVNLLAASHGWRSAFSAGGILVALSAFASLLARRGNNPDTAKGSATGEGLTPTETLSETVSGRVLLLWASGAGLGTVGVTATASFFVPIGVSSGFQTATAGLLALAAGVLAAVVRVGVGMLADHRPRANVSIVVGMMLAGCVGLVVIALGTPATFLAGALLVVAGLWGWNGLLVASAIRLLPGSPARALGGLQVGFFSGATAAPLVFGVLSTVVGVGGALLAAAASAVAGACAVAAGELYRRRFEADAEDTA